MRKLMVLAWALTAAAWNFSAGAQMPPQNIGIVIMHGKGGSPARYVSDLAAALESKGYLVANLDMPWSGRRNYDADVSTAVGEVDAALATLRSKGARKLFIAGHSQGGLFAFYLGGKLAFDGIIAMAPGGNVASPLFRQRLGKHVDLARKLVAEGKGSEKTQFGDYEGAKGDIPVFAPASAYFSWFDPEGAMNQRSAIKNINPQIPVLYIVPTGDYPALLKLKSEVLSMLPVNSLNKLYEPDSSHLNAPAASSGEIIRWTAEVAGKGKPHQQTRASTLG